MSFAESHNIFRSFIYRVFFFFFSIHTRETRGENIRNYYYLFLWRRRCGFFLFFLQLCLRIIPSSNVGNFTVPSAAGLMKKNKKYHASPSEPSFKSKYRDRIKFYLERKNRNIASGHGTPPLKLYTFPAVIIIILQISCCDNNNNKKNTRAVKKKNKKTVMGCIALFGIIRNINIRLVKIFPCKYRTVTVVVCYKLHSGKKQKKKTKKTHRNLAIRSIKNEYHIKSLGIFFFFSFNVNV